MFHFLYCDNRPQLLLHQGRQMNTHFQDLYHQVLSYPGLFETRQLGPLLYPYDLVSFDLCTIIFPYEQIIHVLMDMTYHICHIGVEIKDLLDL